MKQANNSGNNHSAEESVDDDFFEKSKSQLKREHLGIQGFVKELLDMPPKQLKQLPIPESLLDEISLAKKMTRSALKRQIGYIAKQMDVETAQDIQGALEEFQRPHKEAVSAFHQQEAWRDQLLDPRNPHRDALINRLTKDHGADRQRLRQLMRSAEKELKATQPPKSARQLFQYLKQISS